MSHSGGPTRQILAEALASVGYSDQHVEFDWPFLDHLALSAGRPASHPNRLDVVSFYDERRHDWETSALAADLDCSTVVGDSLQGRQHSRRLFEATAAPCVLLSNGHQADLWLRCWETTPTYVEGIGLTPENLTGAFLENRADVERQALARLRGGQQYLFDRFYDARREQLAGFLHVGLEQAVKALRRGLKGITKKEKGRFEESLSHVAMALLAARIFEDKDFFGENRPQSPEARTLLRQAESGSNGFFRHVIENDLATLDRQLGADSVNAILPHIMAHLTGPACFSMITPDMLGDLYERALVANGRRGGRVNIKGIHYTPLSLANHILQRIPIEELPPSQRYIADLACGSGSFLLAASARLRDAFDANEDDSEDSLLVHLRSRVIGNDQDDIALLVARLRYLLTHWVENRTPTEVPRPRLLNRDGLELSLHDFDDVAPSVIVGNPPFHASGGDQMANRFLRKALDLLSPGGFLGMIMPGGFLKMRRQKCPETRRQLLESCELLEVWELPERTVGVSAEQATCAIIARRIGEGSPAKHPVLFKAGYSRQDEFVRANRERLRSTWTYSAERLPGRSGTHWIDDTMGRIISSPIDAIWCKIDLSRTLGGICGDQIAQGINAIGKNARYSDSKKSGYEPYLQHQDSLKAFFVKTEDWRNEPDSRGAYVDPASGHRTKERNWPLYRSHKVIMRGRTNRNARTQTVAAFDGSGVFPENDFRCLGIPKSTRGLPSWAQELISSQTKRDLLLWIVGVLNSPIGHAWIAMSSTPRGILEQVLRCLPIPSSFDSRIPELIKEAKNTARLEDQDKRPVWTMWSNRPASKPGEDFETLAGQVNRLLFESYGLDSDDYAIVRRYLEGMTNPWVDGASDAHIPTYAERRITGVVVSVDVSSQTVVLDMPRYSRKSGGPIRCALPSDMPGWALRPGVQFTCLAPKNTRGADEFVQNPWLLRDFRPLPYAYLPPKELDALAARIPS